MKDRFADFASILETHNAGDRVVVKSVLDAEGIVYFIQGETVAPYLFHAVPMRVMVRRDQAARAKDLLQAIDLSYTYGFRDDWRDADDPEES